MSINVQGEPVLSKLLTSLDLMCLGSKTRYLRSASQHYIKFKYDNTHKAPHTLHTMGYVLSIVVLFVPSLGSLL
jgi:hypothetical protein